MDITPESEEIKKMLDNLQWAKDFIDRYERKHKIKNIVDIFEV